MDDGKVDPRERLRRTTPASYRWPRHVALVAIVLGEYASHRWTMRMPRFPRAAARGLALRNDLAS
jgi:hypothetical protein